MEEYTSFEQMPLSQENYSLKSLILPDGMEEGWYLADISIPDGEENDWVQKLIQITNTSVYTQSLGGKLLVWLNDADTHQPMAGCTVQISDCKSDRTVEGVTDAQGMVTIETGEMADGWLSVRKDDKLTYFQRVPLDQSGRNRWTSCIIPPCTPTARSTSRPMRFAFGEISHRAVKDWSSQSSSRLP